MARQFAATNRLEHATLETESVDGVVLRYGYFYRPGTHDAPDGSIGNEVRQRRFPLPEYARALNAPPPRNLPRWVGRVAAGPYGIHLMRPSPRRPQSEAKQTLRWSPVVSSWRTGFKQTPDERGEQPQA
jgi:hypothetical protein